jgi:hypothetical protein
MKIFKTCITCNRCIYDDVQDNYYCLSNPYVPLVTTGCCPKHETSLFAKLIVFTCCLIKGVIGISGLYMFVKGFISYIRG